MRTFATTFVALLCIGVFATLVAAAPQNGTNSGAGQPGSQAASNQEILFHYIPGGECLDCFVGGVKLRNAPPAPPTASGTIQVPAGVASGAVFAELFWVTLGDTPPPPTETLNGIPLARIPCGPVTASPCWPELYAFAYHANVLGMLSAGANTLSGFADSGILGSGFNTEGATLVVAYHTNGVDKEIIVTCGNDLLENFAGVNSAVLPLPVASPPGLGAELHFIGADGQIAPDEVFWNGVPLDAGDAWEGLDPGPGVGYWDSMEFGVFTAAANTASSSIPTDFWDCVNWVSTVLCVKSGGCQTVPVEPKTWGAVKEQYRK